jgi:hypothetical protein
MPGGIHHPGLSPSRRDQNPSDRTGHDGNVAQADTGGSSAERLEKTVRCERRAAPRRTHGATRPAALCGLCAAPGPVLDWRERLVCSECGSREFNMVVTGTERRQTRAPARPQDQFPSYGSSKMLRLLWPIVVETKRRARYSTFDPRSSLTSDMLDEQA